MQMHATWGGEIDWKLVEAFLAEEVFRKCFFFPLIYLHHIGGRSIGRWVDTYEDVFPRGGLFRD